MWEPRRGDVKRAALLVVAIVSCSSPKPRTPRFNPACPATTPPRCSGASPALDARELARWGPGHLEQTISVRGSLRLERVVCPPRDEYGCKSTTANVYMGWLLLDFAFACECSLDEASIRLNEWPHGTCPMRSPDQTVIVTGKLKYREPDLFYPATYWLDDATMCVVR